MTEEESVAEQLHQLREKRMRKKRMEEQRQSDINSILWSMVWDWYTEELPYRLLDKMTDDEIAEVSIKFLHDMKNASFLPGGFDHPITKEVDQPQITRNIAEFRSYIQRLEDEYSKKELADGDVWPGRYWAHLLVDNFPRGGYRFDRVKIHLERTYMSRLEAMKLLLPIGRMRLLRVCEYDREDYPEPPDSPWTKCLDTFSADEIDQMRSYFSHFPQTELVVTPAQVPSEEPECGDLLCCDRWHDYIYFGMAKDYPLNFAVDGVFWIDTERAVSWHNYRLDNNQEQ